MSDIIQLLPDSVANQIAAGEVIQRPASVIKELVENAVDAGAKNIHVLVTDAGRTSIQVIDDGKGMSETDARLAFERHATSKIREASDLYALQTMGFRGEALASIAAVSQVELKTKQEGTELGIQLLMSGSKVEGQNVVACPQGSNFQVKNLFFNVPARRKFLKSNTTELNNIVTEFQRVALVHPEVSFTLHSNDTEVYNLPETTQRQRILSIFGKKLNQQLLTVEADTSLIHISGYIATPESARKKGQHQFFFVNNRFMRHPYFHKAVMEAYEQLIPAGEQISYFIYFDVEPSSIDVNIHPAKTEIKFQNEQALWQIISAAVKESLGKFNAVPTIDFDTEDMPDIPAFEPQSFPAPPKVNYNTDFDPFKSAQNASGGNYSREKVQWEELYSGVQKASKMNGMVGQDSPSISVDEFPDKVPTYPSDLQTDRQHSVPGLSSEDNTLNASNLFLQLKGRFILTPVKSGLMLIEQHRAHVCVLYQRYMEKIVNQQGTSQGLLFPEMLQIPVNESLILLDIMDDMSALGFDLSDLGNGTFAINGVPSDIEKLNPVEMVRGMIHSVIEKEQSVKDEIQSQIALSLAHSAAIPSGRILSQEEMSHLVDDLFTCPSPNYTPDGKTVLAIIQEKEIERILK